MQPNDATPALVRQIPFFSGLDGQTLSRAAAMMKLEHLRRGQQLAGKGFQELEHYLGGVYFVVRGVVAAYTLTSNGSRKIIFFLGKGKLLNQNVLDTRRCNLYGEVMSDALLLRAPRAEFADLVRARPTLMEELVRSYEVDLWRMSHQLKNTAGYVFSERKVAIKLLKLAQDFGVERPDGVAISFDLTITQMADFAGMPRETVSRVCRRLGDMGLVEYRSRRFIITDRERLAALVRTERWDGCETRSPAPDEPLQK